MMQVIKRSGQREEVSFDKITARLRKMSYGLDTGFVNIIEVSKKVIMGLYDQVSTIELDNLAAETAATMATVHPDYALLPDDAQGRAEGRTRPCWPPASP